jgi:hypothetical protein
MTRFRVGLVLLLAAAAGCGGDRLADVKGTVTFDGRPVPAGVVWFEPDIAGGNTTAPQGFAFVKDGAFDTRANGKGVRAGAYVLRVEAFDGKPANELPFGHPLVSPPYEKPHRFGDGDADVAIDVPAADKSKTAPP